MDSQKWEVMSWAGFRTAFQNLYLKSSKPASKRDDVRGSNMDFKRGKNATETALLCSHLQKLNEVTIYNPIGP